MSPREFLLAMAIAKARRLDAVNMGITQAWHVAQFANLGFAGKLKPLKEYLLSEEKTGDGRQTPQQMKNILHQLAARMGSPVITRKRA